MPALNFAARRPGERIIGRLNRIGLWTLYLKEVRRFWKVWTQTVAARTVTTVLFMAIFSFALGGGGRTPAGVAYEAFIAPGLLMMTILQNAFQNPSSSILISKVQGNIVDVLMPPLSPLELTVGYIAGGITRGLAVGLAVWIAFAAWPGLHPAVVHPLAFAYFAVMGSAFMAAFGAVVGIWADKFDHAAGVNNFVILPLTLLSGTFYSIERLPPMVAKISLYNPFFYLIDGFRYSMIGRADGEIATGVAVSFAATLALGCCVYALLKSGYKLKP